MPSPHHKAFSSCFNMVVFPIHICSFYFYSTILQSQLFKLKDLKSKGTFNCWPTILNFGWIAILGSRPVCSWRTWPNKKKNKKHPKCFSGSYEAGEIPAGPGHQLSSSQPFDSPLKALNKMVWFPRTPKKWGGKPVWLWTNNAYC